MKATDDLRTEHEAILLSLQILEKLIFKGEQTPSSFDISDARGIIAFLKLFADTCHHGKEEGILFPVYEQHGVPNEGGPIGVMLQEHVEGRQYIQSMSQALDQSPTDKINFSIAAKNYISLLRAHIEKENNILYPFGDNFLTNEDQAELVKRFHAHEEQVMGKGKHEELHTQLERWEAKYLGDYTH